MTQGGSQKEMKQGRSQKEMTKGGSQNEMTKGNEEWYEQMPRNKVEEERMDRLVDGSCL